MVMGSGDTKLSGYNMAKKPGHPLISFLCGYLILMTIRDWMPRHNQERMWF